MGLRTPQPANITAATSSGGGFAGLHVAEYGGDAVLPARDANRGIRIPTPDVATPLDTRPGFGRTLSDLGLPVSTGPAFRPISSPV
ncbi:hypothetical protein [Jannaschia pohangensis]|uniref:Uncharacterized protein n=1 Tax=Jannaschia pohangensis TaxID=390807 RepID=A0A1I3PZP8_9RHOB|nr:hypothetical protein [Jannaschia pohangensis]SFJ26366.1 hypothetical protein SAMN04488095_2342 [Jannaschia pohangensis]